MIQEAQQIAAAAEKAAKEAGLSIVVSIVDVHGNPVLLHRMDRAPLHSLDMAFRKAYTRYSPASHYMDSPSIQEANSSPSAVAHQSASQTVRKLEWEFPAGPLRRTSTFSGKHLRPPSSLSR
jgi:uncharacterized protein GlcG (DUF336 family)